jgi:hypothetical protein
MRPALTRQVSISGSATSRNDWRNVTTNGANRRLKPTISIRLAVPYVSTISASSSSVRQSGFSTNTFLPARNAAMTWRACRSWRVTMATVLIAASPRISSEAVAHQEKPKRSAAARAERPPPLLMATRRTPSAFCIAGMSVPFANSPAPSMPTFTPFDCSGCAVPGGVA